MKLTKKEIVSKHITLPSETMRQLEELAKETNRSPSEVIGILVTHAYKSKDGE